MEIILPKKFNQKWDKGISEKTPQGEFKKHSHSWEKTNGYVTMVTSHQNQSIDQRLFICLDEQPFLFVLGHQPFNDCCSSVKISQTRMN